MAIRQNKTINRICTCSWSSPHSHSARSRHTLVHSVPWCDASTHTSTRGSSHQHLHSGHGADLQPSALQSGSAFLWAPECERTHARLLLLGLLWRLGPHVWSKQRHVISQPEPDCHHTRPTEAHTFTVPCVSQQRTHRPAWHEGQSCRRPVKGRKHAHAHQGPCPRYSDIQQTLRVLSSLLQLHGRHQRWHFGTRRFRHKHSTALSTSDG